MNWGDSTLRFAAEVGLGRVSVLGTGDSHRHSRWQGPAGSRHDRGRPGPGPRPPTPGGARRGYAEAGVAAGASGMRPSPRGFGERTYAIEPKTMIEKTLITRSRSAIAVASASGTP